MQTLIKAQGLTKAYQQGNDKTVALNGVELDLKDGEFVAVMGPSGSGKSTLLFVLAGIDQADSGTLHFRDVDLRSLKNERLADLRRRHMGFVFQQATMLKTLNLMDNILLPLWQEKKKERRNLQIKARELMQKTGIEALAERDIGQVSGGQLQRAGICRALMSEPDILFADEPTGALNSAVAGEIMELFTDVNRQGTAIFVVTHDARVAARASRVLFMKDGAILKELIQNPHTEAEGAERTAQVLAFMQELGI